ncbi:MAG: WD40/YVTN/BNR-like repeat-containing protein, partial [Blastocatellia bacterium]
MQNVIGRLKNNPRLTLFVAFALLLLMAGALTLPGAASADERKGKKGEGKEKNKAPEWLERARRIRRTVRGEVPPSSKGGDEKTGAAAGYNRFSITEQRDDGVEDFASPFDFSPGRLFKEIFGELRGKPRERAQHFIQKRLPEDEKGLPIEKYFEAQERMRGMRHFSTALDRFVTNSENLTAPLSAAEAAPNGANWTPLGPGNIGGRTRAILINPQDPNVIYAAGVSGGVWKTTNGGQSWRPIADLIGNITVSSMAMEPGNPNVIYVGTGEGVYGFEQDTSVGDFRGAGIFKTTDGGANWTRLDGTRGRDFYYVNDLVISPNDKNRIYAATGTGVWRSVDGGANWTRGLEPKNEDDDLVIGGCLDLAIRTDTQTDFVFASCGTFEPATIYRNTDASASGTWEGVLTQPDMGRTSLAIAPSNQEIVYALASSIDFGPYELGLHAVFRSTSGGAANSWTTQVSNTSQNKLNRLLLSLPLVGTLTDCQYDLSDDVISQGWYDNVIAVDPVDPNIVWAGGIEIWRSNDGGMNWGIGGPTYVGPSFDGGPIHPDIHTIVFHPRYDGASNQMMFVGNDGG